MTVAALRPLWAFPALRSGQTETLKWIAWAIMLQGHVNTYLFGRGLAGAYELGRLAFPVFGFVLAANLARRWSRELVQRVCGRLLIFGLLAQPFLIYLSGSLRLNIMFTLGAGVMLAYALQARGAERWGLGIAAVLIGPFCEFDVMGVAYVAAVVTWATGGRWLAALMTVAGLVALYMPNHNWYALLALPVFVLAQALPELPRARGWFYYLYPAHFALLSAIRFFS